MNIRFRHFFFLSGLHAPRRLLLSLAPLRCWVRCRQKWCQNNTSHVSVVSDIAKEEIDGLICAYRVGKVINDVEREKNKLISNRDVVQEKIEATEKTEKVNDALFDWLKEMEKLVQEVENLTINTQVTEQPGSFREFRRLRADHAMRYEMYDEMLKKIKALNIKCDIEPFSSPIPGLEHYSSDKIFVCFKPLKEALEQLLEALRDDNCYIIGLYGKRGSGKTKLVKAVGEKAKYSRIFHEVLFLTVSRNPNVRRIQDEIADLLNLKFDRNTTEAGRARKIYSTLESMDSPILVILDDVWAKLDPCMNLFKRSWKTPVILKTVCIYEAWIWNRRKTTVFLTTSAARDRVDRKRLLAQK